MSGGFIGRCASPAHAADEIAPATGRVRYVRNTDDVEVVSAPLCDGCQVRRCRALREQASRQEVRDAYAVPLDYREPAGSTYVDTIRQATERHPGTDAEVASDVVAALTDPTRPYVRPALPSLVLDLLQQWAAERDEGAATMAAEIDPEEVF